MKKLVVILVIYVLYGCSLNHRIAGKYISATNSNTFQFFPDLTFLNEYQIGHSVLHAKGTWAIEKKEKLVLNTEIKSTVILLKVKKSEASSPVNMKVEVHINIINGLDLSNYQCYLWVDHRQPQIVRCDSLSSFSVQRPADSINFVVVKEIKKQSDKEEYALKSEKITFNHSSRNDIVVDMSFNDSLFYYHPFNNDVFEIHKHGIEKFNSHTKKWDYFKKVPKSSRIFFNFSG